MSKVLQAKVNISAVWLRRIGDNAEVLVEVDGKWLLAITEHWVGNYSQIAEVNGIRNWKEDTVTKNE